MTFILDKSTNSKLKQFINAPTPIYSSLAIKTFKLKKSEKVYFSTIFKFNNTATLTLYNEKICLFTLFKNGDTIV